MLAAGGDPRAGHPLKPPPTGCGCEEKLFPSFHCGQTAVRVNFPPNRLVDPSAHYSASIACIDSRFPWHGKYRLAVDCAGRNDYADAIIALHLESLP